MVEHYEHNKDSGHAGELATRIVETLSVLPSAATILDVGCGKGIVASIITRINPALHYTGCDISDEAINHCKNTIKGEFFVGDVEKDLATPAKEYDVVLCLEVLEHVRDKQRVFERLLSKTKKEGTLVITTPNLSSAFVKLKKIKDGILRRGRYDAPMSFDELATLARQHATIQLHKTFYRGIYQLLVVKRR
ncbi:MAG: class I SAM-dependent methyltransferase [Nanoarchaeota archaeon]